MTLEEKLKEAQALSEKPVEMSEPEKEILTNVISKLKEVLDQVLTDALEMPRDEAFKKVSSYVEALINAPKARQALIKEVAEKDEEVEDEKPKKLMEHPELEELLSELPAGKRTRALLVLSCLKQYNKLEEEGEDGRQALCPECTPEKMLECINLEDPQIVVGVGEEIERQVESTRGG